MSMPREKLVFFANYIEKELGIVYSDSNYFQLQNRLEEIIKQLNLGSQEALWDKAQKGIDGLFKQLLLDVATNNETSFFRDPKIFKAIENHILPNLVKRNLNRPIQIWSAASSFGQEIFSLSILLTENKHKYPGIKWKILGTDIAERALAKCRAAKYSQLEVQRGLSAPLLVKYFTKDAESYWSIKPELVSDVTFKKQNLLDSFVQLGTFDLVLCRNVLIYQKVENKKNVLDRIAKQLNPGGYLIMGAGESLIGITENFQNIQAEGVVIYQLKDSAQQKKAA